MQIPLRFQLSPAMLRRMTPQLFAATPAVLAVRATPALRKSNDPTYEDDRWLEAGMDVEKTPEERYAAEQQAATLKRMMAQVRKETHAKVEKHVDEVKAKESAKVDQLEATVKALQEQIAALKK